MDVETPRRGVDRGPELFSTCVSCDARGIKMDKTNKYLKKKINNCRQLFISADCITVLLHFSSFNL